MFIDIGDVNLANGEARAVIGETRTVIGDGVGATDVAGAFFETRGKTKIRVLKVQSGNAFPQIVIWRCPQINRQPSREGWLEKPKLGKAGSVNAIF